ncbi:uncharacterized protein LOC141914079 [Tubulanus polymorphus]|uniref:uncharacterized protein LOC141914079 n=1 Tax=Tubulanus polymorphus TaxID=672921 RepID=UPI003DA27E46
MLVVQDGLVDANSLKFLFANRDTFTSPRSFEGVLFKEHCQREMRLQKKKTNVGTAKYGIVTWIRDGSFFSKSKMKLSQLMLTVYCFGLDLQQFEVMTLQPDTTTIMECYRLLQDVMSTALVQAPLKFSELATDMGVVEIYESKIWLKSQIS